MDDDDMTFDDKRHDQLTRAPKSDESDAAPRVTITEADDGTKRVDVASTAKVTPGKAPRSEEA